MTGIYEKVEERGETYVKARVKVLEDEEETYYGVIIPFETREQANFARVKVNRVLGYGCWIHVGIFNGNGNK